MSLKYFVTLSCRFGLILVEALVAVALCVTWVDCPGCSLWVLILLNWCKLISFITATNLKVTGSWSGHSWVKVNLLHFFSVSQRIHTSLICHGKLQRTQVRLKHGSHLLTDTWGNHLFCFWGLFFCCFQVSIPHIFHVHTVDICVCRSLIG